MADGTLKDETTVLGLYLARQRLAERRAGCRDGGAAPRRRGVPLLARGGAGTLAADAGGLPARPGVLPGGPGGGGGHAIDAAIVRRRGGAPRRAAPDPQRGVGGPGALEHPRLPPLPRRGGAARRRPHPRPAVDLGDRPAAQGAERGGDGAAARRGRRDRPRRPARPGAPRGALRHGRPGERGGRV